MIESLKDKMAAWWPRTNECKPGGKTKGRKKLSGDVFAQVPRSFLHSHSRGPLPWSTVFSQVEGVLVATITLTINISALIEFDSFLLHTYTHFPAVA